MARMFEYFVVCGLGPEIRTVDGNRGFHGTGGVQYLPSLLDEYPPPNHSLYPPPPPQLPTVRDTSNLLLLFNCFFDALLECGVNENGVIV